MKTAFHSRRRASRASRRNPGLKVSPALSRELVRFADLLEVRPAEFLHWHLSDWVWGSEQPQ